jgi:hypothetical protein
MGKNYDIPEIVVYLKGGVIQSVTIPKDANAKVIVKDYDIDIEPGSKDAEGYNIKKDEDGVYEEGIWEN